MYLLSHIGLLDPSSVRFYLPDALWGYALQFTLSAIWGNTIKRLCFTGMLTTAYGALWELLQYKSIAPGTGDPWDVFVYIVAAVLVVCILYTISVEES